MSDAGDSGVGQSREKPTTLSDDAGVTELRDAAGVGPGSAGASHGPVAASSDGDEDLEFLLISIDDLEREHDAGDMDDATYAALRSKYVASAAERIRADGLDVADTGRQSRRARPSRTVLVWLGAAAIAAIIGTTFAHFSGSRAPGESLTGSTSLSSRLDGCASMGPANPKGADCYEAVLVDFPDQPEALTYSGWAKIRGGDIESGAAQLDRAVKLDPKLPDPHVFLAVAASRDNRWADAQAEIDRVYQLDPPPALVSVMQQQSLELKVAEGALSSETAACWKQMRSILEASDKAASAKTIIATIECLRTRADALDAQLGAQPDDRDPVVAKEAALVNSLLGFVIADSDDRLVDVGLERLAYALTMDPGNPTTLMLRGFVYGSQQRFDAAKADADAAAAAKIRPSGLVTWFLGQPSDLVQAVSNASSNGPSGPS